MAKGGKAAAATAAAEAAAAAAARLPPNVAHGVRVTVGYFVLYYLFILAQVTVKRKLRTYYTGQGKKVQQYALLSSTKMHGWFWFTRVFLIHEFARVLHTMIFLPMQLVLFFFILKFYHL